MSGSNASYSESCSLLAQFEKIVRGEEVCIWWGGQSLSFGEVEAKSGVVAAALLRKVNPKDRVLLCYAPGPEFLVAFLACLRTGVIAVPVYPPDPSKMLKAIEKLSLVRDDCGAALCCTDGTVNMMRLASWLRYSWPSNLTWWNTQGTTRPFFLWRSSISDRIDEKDLALLQFTSGSTGQPKGVMLSHSNVWHNLNRIYLPLMSRTARAAGVEETSRLVGVNVLPQYHDTGLILMLLGPLLAGWKMTHISPLEFIKNPLAWLDALSAASWSAMPDFCYDLVARRLESKKNKDLFLEGIDLTSVVKLGAGVGQRCRPASLARFYEMVAGPTGLRDAQDLWMPAYGLAEHVVATTFETDGIVLSSRTDPRGIASCGSCFACVLKIVDVETQLEVEPGVSGELWIHSPSVARGYWGRPDLSEETFGARLAGDQRPFLRTGDLAFLEDGRLFICGRLRDLVLSGGKNYYPEDIEASFEDSCAGRVRPGAIAAFSVENDDANEEELVVVFELYPAAVSSAEAVAAAATTAVARDVGLRPSRVVAIKDRTIPKTTSGKIRRSATRQAYLSGTLQVIYDSGPPLFRSTSSDENNNRSPTEAAASDDVSKLAVEVVVVVSDDDDDDDDDEEEESSLAKRASSSSFLEENGGTICAKSSSNWAQHLEDSVLEALRTTTTTAEFSRMDEKTLLDRVATATLGRSTTSSLRGRTIATPEDVVKVIQEEYVQGIIVAKARDLLGKREIDSSSRLSDQGLTSQEAARLVQEIDDSLGLEVEYDQLLELSIEALARALLSPPPPPPKNATTTTIEKISVDEEEGEGRVAPPRGDWLLMDLLQCFGVLIVATLVALALVPCYHFGLAAQWKLEDGVYAARDNPPFSHIRVAPSVTTTGLLVVLVFPLFAASLSLIAVVAKWLVVGKYRSCRVERGSILFFRWWLVDRIFDQWELWCGAFVRDTLQIHFFYRLCGAQVAWSCRLDTFLREFDLVAIGEGARVQGAIYARAFEPGKILRFAPVVLETGAVLASSAILTPGCVMEPNAKLDHAGAAVAGSRFEAASVYSGSPARRDDAAILRPTEKATLDFSREALKIFVLLAMLYALVLLPSILVAVALNAANFSSWHFRYRGLAFYVVTYLAAATLSIPIAVATKWLVLGKSSSSSSSFGVGRWAVDYAWHRVACRFGLLAVGENGCLPNLVWRLLGARVALSASISAIHAISASEADFATIGPTAVLSGFVLSCTGADGRKKPTTIHGQVGYLSRVHAGATIHPRAVVGHQTIVAEDEVVSGVRLHDATFAPAVEVSRENAPRVRSWQCLLERAVVVILFGVGLVLAYELAVLAFFGAANYYKDTEYLSGWRRDGTRWTPPVDRNLAVLLLGVVGLVAIASISFAYRLWQFVVLDDFRRTPSRSAFLSSYFGYQTVFYEILQLAMPLVRGSRLAVSYLRFWGARVHETAFINSHYFYEPTLLELAAGCVLDDKNTNIAHVFRDGRLHFAPKKISRNAILHPHCVTWAGDVVPPNVVMGPRSQLATLDTEDPNNNNNNNGDSFAAEAYYLQGCPARRIRL
ncbi:hypothetical protein CTAYLR_001599 [Chrysophaeum taylorii]|uniref:AMP-dependent synthetase/ligase domain-containing protein n=1 Tax=Chrysophaeum taylorii TaxID=2483200 RepID=A0AAD7XHU9_9STRA|nr:hypothetical protein CTAYLR_001599 [Chrysophaeum taylorii]